jgi:teichoic acid transport system permease protein
VIEESPSALAGRYGLIRVGIRPRFGKYLADTWRRRNFARTLARYRIQSENERNRLGMAWVVIKPLLNALIYGLVFGLILDNDSRPENFIAFLLVGVFIFEYFGNSFGQGSKAIISNTRLVRSLSFPRILLPIAVLLEQLYRMVPILGVLGVLLLVVGESARWSWLLIVPIIFMMSFFNAGVAMIVARMSVHLRDIKQVIPVVSRIVFYTSGIFYSLDLILAHRPDLLLIVHLTPVYEFISLSRNALLADSTVDPSLWLWAGLWAAGTFVFGVVFFWRAEERYGRD